MAPSDADLAAVAAAYHEYVAESEAAYRKCTSESASALHRHAAECAAAFHRFAATLAAAYAVTPAVAQRIAAAVSYRKYGVGPLTVAYHKYGTGLSEGRSAAQPE